MMLRTSFQLPVLSCLVLVLAACGDSTTGVEAADAGRNTGRTERPERPLPPVEETPATPTQDAGNPGANADTNSQQPDDAGPGAVVDTSPIPETSDTSRADETTTTPDTATPPADVSSPPPADVRPEDSGLPSECTDGQTRPCYSGPGGTQGIGRCTAGAQTCITGRWSLCQGEVLPMPAEECNGIDDDCDGRIDNGQVFSFLQRTCTNACGSGTETCTAGVWQGCSAPLPAPAEICGNGLDDNCNGAVDEGCEPACDRSRLRVGVATDPVYVTRSTAEALATQLTAGGREVSFLSNLADRDVIEGNYDLLIASRFSVANIGTPAALQTWIEAGNALLVLGTGFSSDCSPSMQTLLRGFDIAFACDRLAQSPVTLLIHPSVNGMPAPGGAFSSGNYVHAIGGRARNVLTANGGTASANAQRNAGVAAEVGCGKVFVWGSAEPGREGSWIPAQGFWTTTTNWLLAP
jgi:hypothetical protein